MSWFRARPLRCAVALLLLCCSSSLLAASVEVFSPQGEVKGVRQVSARFSEPMVAFFASFPFSNVSVDAEYAVNQIWNRMADDGLDDIEDSE